MKPLVKILILDKEEIIFKAIKRALKNDKEIQYNITYCTTAFDGLKYIRSDKFNLVLIDLVLPGMNAIEALRRIKNIDPKIPVVLMSGFTKNELQDDTLNNVSGFLIKPFTTEEIRSLILRILKTEKIN